MSVVTDPTRSPQQTLRRWIPLGWLLVAIACFVCTFVLPFQFPLKEPVLSAAYQMGANNRAAEVSLALLSVLVTLTVAWFHLREKPETGPSPQGLSRTWLWGAIALLCLWTAALGFVVARSDVFWGDEGYFLNQLRTGLVFHRGLYRGFEFPYGPALYLWPATFLRAFGALGVARTPAYLVSLASLQALGLGLLFYTVDALPLSRRLKLVAFAVFTLAAMTPFLGINYAIFRFIFPFAALTLLCRCRTSPQAALVAGLGVIAQFLVSPELAVAFFAGAFIYGVYRAWTAGRSWLLVCAAAIAGVAVFGLFAGKAYFLTMASIAKGGFNLLLQPMPHVLILLVAVVAIAPVAVGRALAARGPGTGYLLALYVASLALLPAAMGRADAVHLLMNGIGLYLVSLVAVQSLSPRGGTIWAGAVIAACLLTVAVNLRAYGPNIAELPRHSTVGDLQIPRLEQELGGQPVSAPAGLPPRTIDALTARGLYRPGFYCGLVGVWDQAAEERIVAEMRGDAFALLPGVGAEAREPLDTSRFKQALRLGYAYKARHPEVIIGQRINAEVRANWVPVDRFGYYTLYRRMR